MLDSLLHALGVAGDFLDVPAGITRDLFVGKNPLPGIIHPEQRATGRDVLKQWGLAGENKPGLDAGDVGGFLVENLLDPMNLVGGGLISKALKGTRAAKHSGTFAKMIHEMPTVTLDVTRKIEPIGQSHLLRSLIAHGIHSGLSSGARLGREDQTASLDHPLHIARSE